jgi:large conductance mechanosensitive channel
MDSKGLGLDPKGLDFRGSAGFGALLAHRRRLRKLAAIGERPAFARCASYGGLERRRSSDGYVEASNEQVREPAMLKKFQDFAIKGNAFDLAVGVIIGAAFGGIVTSLVGDIFMPIIGAVTGGLDFSNYFIRLSSKVTADSLVEAKKQGAVLAWGAFLTITINFMIVAAVLFALVNFIQKVRQREEAKPSAAPPRQEVLLTEIRDLLAKRS